MLISSFVIFLFVVMFIITLPLLTLDFKSVNAQKIDEKGKLKVVSNINLQNIEKEGMLKVVGVINGEDFVKKIPLDKLKDTTKKLKVTFSMDKDNEFVNADKRDEFFVCAYHVLNPNTNDVTNNVIDYFDCNEGDIKSTTKPSEANIFKEKSQVFNKTLTYYNMHSKPKVVSFDTLENDDSLKVTNYTSVNIELDKSTSSKSNGDNNNQQSVKVKIIVPMEDRKAATKIKIMAMLKGQIQSEIIEDVQNEFKKIKGHTIERTFDFDKNTEIGPIQIGDRFHACVIGQELNPPEGSECEKRLIKHLDKPNILTVR